MTADTANPSNALVVIGEPERVKDVETDPVAAETDAEATEVPTSFVAVTLKE